MQEKSSQLSEQAVNSGIDPETKRKLLSLGYIRAGGPPDTSGEKPDPKTMIGLDKLFNEAMNASEAGRFEMAKNLFEKVLRRQPDFVVGYEYAAHNLHSMGRIPEAIQLLETAVREDTATAPLLSRLGLYYQENGEIDESLKVLGKALAINPHDAEAYNYLGISLYRSGRIEEAVEAFHQSLSLDKSYAMAMNNLANCYLALERIDKAVEGYEKAIMVDGSLASAHNGLAVAYYRQGKVEKALSAWEKSIELEPSQTEPLYNLGRVHLRRGDKRKALRFFELFLKYATAPSPHEDFEEVKGVVERLKKELKKS